MERQFTATLYIFFEGKTLLHCHPKLGKWVPPGGHLEPNETPPEAAIREAKEETGLDVAILEQENLKVDGYNGVSFPRPFLCLLEHIPAHGGKEAHQHMDMIYIGEPKGIPAPEEDLQGFRWFAHDELTEIENELFPDVKEVIRLLLKEKGIEAFYQRR